MAKKLAIIRPLPIVTISGFANASRLLTPDPKEAMSMTAGAVILSLDLGVAQLVDTFFLGYVAAGTTLGVTYGVAAHDEATAFNTSPIQGSELVSADCHLPFVIAAPVNARYVKFYIGSPANGKAGVIAVGKSFQANWGHEYGSGRPVEDTGSVERLLSGGFGINEGVRVGGYNWTFGDLDDSEVQKLYAISRDRGVTRSVLVIEDIDQTFGLNERTHWSLFGKLEAYERQVPGASRYSFTVRDWA